MLTGKIAVKYTYNFMYNIDDIVYKTFESYDELLHFMTKSSKKRLIFLLEIKELGNDLYIREKT